MKRIFIVKNSKEKNNKYNKILNKRVKLKNLTNFLINWF